MHDWIVGLQKALVKRKPGATSEEIRNLEAEVGQPFPKELEALYLAFNGGSFLPGLTLYPIRSPAGQRSVARAEGAAWTFGATEKGEMLIAARPSAREWIYRLAGPGRREPIVFKSLEQMLKQLVPPAVTEDFGEETFHRALAAVTNIVEGATDRPAAKKPRVKRSGTAKAGKVTGRAKSQKKPLNSRRR